jgi:hypothetical protein
MNIIKKIFETIALLLLLIIVSIIVYPIIGITEGIYFIKWFFRKKKGD